MLRLTITDAGREALAGWSGATPARMLDDADGPGGKTVERADISKTLGVGRSSVYTAL
jgi:hypothetical protein